MENRKSNQSVMSTVIAVAVFAAVALWQFYVFVTFKDSAGTVDIQGGATHLWWAIGFGLTAFIVAFVGASYFLRYDRHDEIHITSPPSPRGAFL